MYLLRLTHRWLGVAFCALFAMWFASGIVMHFVPFPSLKETQRFDGLIPIDLSLVVRDPSEAVIAGGINDATRVRLLQRIDGPVYVVSGTSGTRSVHAGDLSTAAVAGAQLALDIAKDNARRRGMDASRAIATAVTDYDQWTVPNAFDRHRPLYRVALQDANGTEIYISSVTGEVVLDTTRSQRWWNYAGSVVHWIYPTSLRNRWTLWDAVVWRLSLLAMIAAISGSVLGVARWRPLSRRLKWSRAGWQGWHHLLGLICGSFVLTWTFSGWLSMDHGRLFSRGQLTEAERMALGTPPLWRDLTENHSQKISSTAREVEWFVFDGRFYRRERIGFDGQTLVPMAGAGSRSPGGFLEAGEVGDLVQRLADGCAAPRIVATNDHYPVRSSVPGAPVYRSICNDVWLQVDGASGEILERLDRSRRAYRWLYSALHTADLPGLRSHPYLQSALIVSLCGFGLLFSATGVVIGWRRLRSTVSARKGMSGRR